MIRWCAFIFLVPAQVSGANGEELMLVGVDAVCEREQRAVDVRALLEPGPRRPRPAVLPMLVANTVCTVVA